MGLCYGDKIIYVEGIITNVHSGSVEIDLKGKLGHLAIPKRMLITEIEPQIGQNVGWNMSFVEQLFEDSDLSE